MNRATSHPDTTRPNVLRIGCVSFLNTKPIIFGLDREPDLALSLDVPSRLLDGLRERRYDVALLPVIDYQRLPGLRVIPASGIASDGPTLTVRIFSRVPIGRIATLACDTDSHTSVALARILLSRAYSIRPECIDLTASGAPDAEARLLIGDKVVREEPVGFAYDLDLGEAWKRLTNLPFVFATWMAGAEVDLRDLPRRLARSRELGMSRIDAIVDEHAVPHGWPKDLARKYLTRHLEFRITPRHIEAIRLFHRYAAEENLAPLPPRELEVSADVTP